MTYIFTFSVDGFATVKVEADNYEDAEKQANNAVNVAGLGDLEDVDMALTSVTSRASIWNSKPWNATKRKEHCT